MPDVLSVEPEPNNPNPEFRRVSYAELYALVSDIVSAFLAHGLKPGDRVASYSSNCIVRTCITVLLTPMWLRQLSYTGKLSDRAVYSCKLCKSPRSPVPEESLLTYLCRRTLQHVSPAPLSVGMF